MDINSDFFDLEPAIDKQTTLSRAYSLAKEYNQSNALFEIFPWNSSFETGISEIDEQHKVLVGLINIIASSIRFDDISLVFEKHVNAILKFTQFHFTTEEKIWEEHFHGKVNLKSHIKSHDNFIYSITELLSNTQYQTLQKKLEELITLLTGWLIKHILDSDMRMGLIVVGMKSGLSYENAEKQTDKKMKGVMGEIVELSLFMYNNLCKRTLELNTEINTQKHVERNLYNEVKKHQSIKFQASSNFYDKLTGLYTKQLFEEQSIAFIKTAERSNLNKAILFIKIEDIPEFEKDVRQNLYDELFVTIAQVMKDSTHESDILARLNHQTFAILLTSECSSSEPETISSDIMEVLSKPLILNNNKVAIGININIKFYPKDGDFSDELLKRTINDNTLEEITSESKYAYSDIKDKLNKLTPREEDVLGHVINGKTNKEIARNLGISIKTVEFHRSHLMKKMETNSLVDLVKITMAAEQSV